MHSLTKMIESRTEEILAHWQQWLSRAGESGSDPVAFSQVVPQTLAELAARADELLSQDQSRWWPQSPLMPAVRAHAIGRRKVGATPDMIAREWQLLRTALWSALAGEFQSVSAEQALKWQIALNYAFDDLLTQLSIADRLFEAQAAQERSRAAERAAFNQQLAIEVERAARYRRSCSLGILDITHLRSVNEKLGRQSGDRLVEDIAALLRRGLRQADRAFRYGGDEFVAILPETDFTAASVVFNRIGESAARYCQEFKLPQDVCLHWGIASFPEDAEEARSLFLLADNRLREKKRGTVRKPERRRQVGATVIGFE